MSKELSNFQELVRLVKARLARASTAAEVEALQQQVRAKRIHLLGAGLDNTDIGDQARKADRLCAVRLHELRQQELARLFE